MEKIFLKFRLKSKTCIYVVIAKVLKYVSSKPSLKSKIIKLLSMNPNLNLFVRRLIMKKSLLNQESLGFGYQETMDMSGRTYKIFIDLQNRVQGYKK